MVELRWIQMSLFLMLLLQFTGAAGQVLFPVDIRCGHEVTLPCRIKTRDQINCNYFHWNVIPSGRGEAVDLTDLLLTSRFVPTDSDRMSFAEDCSLVVQNITNKSAGRYFCREFDKPGRNPAPESEILLSVASCEDTKITTAKQPTMTSLMKGTAGDDITGGTSVTTSSNNDVSTNPKACSGCSAVNYIMLVLRVVELLLITLITVLLFRASGKQRPSDDHTVLNSVRNQIVMHSGPAANQVKHDEDEDEGVVKYENVGDSSASVVLH